jgi:GNAT superfamily N-acetyltransferase
MTSVRKYSPNEWEAVRDVRLAALLDSPEAFSSSLEREIAFDENDWKARFKDRGWFLAEDGDTFAGIAGHFHPPDQPEDVYHLIGMWVHPEHRGSDVAALLIDAVKEDVRAIGGHQLSLLIVPNNIPAQKFYEKVGFSLHQAGVKIDDNPSETYDEMTMTL